MAKGGRWQKDGGVAGGQQEGVGSRVGIAKGRSLQKGGGGRRMEVAAGSRWRKNGGVARWQPDSRWQQDGGGRRMEVAARWEFGKVAGGWIRGGRRMGVAAGCGWQKDGGGSRVEVAEGWR